MSKYKLNLGEVKRRIEENVLGVKMATMPLTTQSPLTTTV